MTETLSRRALNKAANRSAIAQSAVTLLRQSGYGNFTVEDVAENAGVSRRTFFNYFSSADAAMSAPIENFLEVVLENFNQRPSHETLLDSAVHALTAIADPSHLGPIADIYELSANNEALMRCQLEAWSHTERKLISTAQERLGGNADPLYVQALVASIFAVGKAAVDDWFTRYGADTSAEALQDMKHTLIRAFAYLRDGFHGTTPPLT